MRAILQFVLLIVLILVSLVLVVGISLGIGWALTLILPFSLFEGTVVSMVAAFVTWTIWHRIFGLLSIPGFAEEGDEEESEIPESRFWESKAERTWENWFRYVFANTIYEELADSRDWSGDMGERALQEQAIRLADAAVEGLKGKPSYTKRLRISPETLKHELAKMGQQRYHDEILETAADAANAELMDWEDEVREVIRERSWGEPAEVD